MYKFLSIGEAATYLGITKKALRRRIEKGNGPPVMHSGRRVEISEDVLLDWMKRKKEFTSQPTPKEVNMSELEKSLGQVKQREEGFISKEQREVNEVKARYVDLIKQGRETIARISKMRAKYGAQVEEIYRIFTTYDLKGDSPGTTRPHLKSEVFELTRIFGGGGRSILEGISILESLTVQAIKDGEHVRGEQMVHYGGTADQIEKTITGRMNHVAMLVERIMTSGGWSKHSHMDSLPTGSPITEASPVQRTYATGDKGATFQDTGGITVKAPLEHHTDDGNK